MSYASTIDPQEVAKFSAMAEEWWDPHGKFKPLHRLNPVRISYLKQILPPLAGLTILDIGCGGGLLSVPLARLGAQVTGIDASEKNICIATLHAEAMDIPVTYRFATAEELAAEGQQFDAVLMMEVIEHVADVARFITAGNQLLKPGGTMVIATLNRTFKSFLFGIVGAEYILRWLPKGTHSWEKFLRPSEIAEHLEREGLKLQEMKGISYHPLRDQFALSDDIEVNYMMVARKS